MKAYLKLQNKTTILLLVFILKAVAVFTQNLVPNPGFEELKQVPCTYTLAYDQFEENIEDWVLPTLGSPDIYSTLAGDSCFANPQGDLHVFGKHSPHSGNNFGGLYATTYCDCSAGLCSEGPREYMSVELVSPLVIGDVYHFEAFISLPKNLKYATSHFGAFFSDTLPTSLLPGFPQYSPQFFDTTIIEDKDGWVKVSGQFTSTTTSRFMTIGYFHSICDMNFKQVDTSGYDVNYYYIDDIVLKQFSKSVDTIWACLGEDILIDSYSGAIEDWSIENTNNTIASDTIFEITPLQDVSVFSTYDCHIHETVILVKEQLLDLGNDTTLCYGDSLLLDLSTVDGHVVWDDNTTDEVRTVSHSGLYGVTITDQGCIYQDSIEVDVLPASLVDLGEDITICEGDSVSLSSNIIINDLNYKWNNGYENANLVVNNEGEYSLKVTIGVCEDSSSIDVFVDLLPKIELDNYLDTCIPESVIISPVVWYEDNITWNDGSTGLEKIVASSGIYTLSVSNDCGSISHSVQVEIKDCRPDVLIPNVFTPNLDADNEDWELFHIEEYPYFQLTIVNRWGNVVHQQNGQYVNWNGRRNQQLLPSGTYYYILDVNELNKVYTGTVTILY